MLVRWLIPFLLIVAAGVIGWLTLHKKDPEATEMCRSASDSECNDCCKTAGAAVGVISIIRVGGQTATQCVCRR